jgi:hypothetical protein
LCTDNYTISTVLCAGLVEPKTHAKTLMLATFNRKEKERLENDEEWEEEEEEKLEERNSEDMEKLDEEILEKKKDEEGLNSHVLLHKDLPDLLKVSGGLSILLLFFFYNTV